MITVKAASLESWLRHASTQATQWLVLVALLLATQISPWWFPTPDANSYLSIARGIALHHNLRNLGSAHLAYLPGYPLLVSPVFLLSEQPFLALSILHWLMATLFMLGVYRWAMRQAPRAALLIAGLAVLNAAFWIYLRRTLSELAFMTAMIWMVVLLDDALATKPVLQCLRKVVAGTLLLAATALIREAGALFAGGFAVLAIREVLSGRIRWPRALWMILVTSLPVTAALMAFIVWDERTAHTGLTLLGTHLNGFTSRSAPLMRRVARGLRLEISVVGRLAIPGMFKAYGKGPAWLDPALLLYLAVFGVVAMGWWRFVRRQRDLLATTVPLYFLLYVFWSFDADTRYLLPILPAILVCLWVVLQGAEKWRLTALAALLVVHLAVAFGYWAAVEVPHGRECNRQWAWVEALRINLENQPGTVVAGPPLPDCARLMLSFVLDRPVLRNSDAVPPSAPVRFVIVPTGEPAPAGFRWRASAGDYQLLDRVALSANLAR